ncbi:hypothetical protein [Staphylococcus muscae]|nr:hypothetical protein [Staphylococcus muscae]PNY97888.1 hypothetical protein CD131_10345 [Staphylococcus muscae]
MDTVYNNEENYYVYIKLIQSLHNQLIVGEKNEQIIYAVQKFITKSYHGFLINIFLKDLITFSEEEKAWTFDQIQPIYQDVNYKMVEKLSEHRIMKTIYYGLVTNNKSLFVNPILNVDRIVIRDKILTHPDYLRKLEMHSIHLYAAIERFIEDDEDYVFIGELVSNNAYINHNLQNSFVFLLKELEGQTLECPVQKFNKLESPYRKQENDAPCGIKVRIPKSYVNNKIGSLELQMCIIEKATQERKYIGVLAHDLLHQYKREGNQPISLNIRENRTIEMIIDEMPEDSATDETV